jgi:hypothetical protein
MFMYNRGALEKAHGDGIQTTGRWIGLWQEGSRQLHCNKMEFQNQYKEQNLPFLRQTQDSHYQIISGQEMQLASEIRDFPCSARFPL